MEIVLLMLMAMWSMGCLGCAFAVLCYFLNEEGPLAASLLCGVLLPIAVGLAWFPWVVRVEVSSPDLAVLKKGEWACSSSRAQPVTTMAGKVPITTYHHVFHAYVRTD